MNNKIIFSVLSVLVVSSFSNITNVFADYDKEPEFLNLATACNGQECYFGTQRPTSVIFEVKAVDGAGDEIKVECDQYSGHIFPLGKSKVHCMAKDIFGHEIRGNFIVTVGYNVVQIPSWFKHIVGYWLDGLITDQEYFNSIGYLINRGLIDIPSIGDLKNTREIAMPSWIIDYSEKWYDGKTGNHEFSIVLQWLIENGFVKQ